MKLIRASEYFWVQCHAMPIISSRFNHLANNSAEANETKKTAYLLFKGFVLFAL